MRDRAAAAAACPVAEVPRIADARRSVNRRCQYRILSQCRRAAVRDANRRNIKPDRVALADHHAAAGDVDRVRDPRRHGQYRTDDPRDRDPPAGCRRQVCDRPRVRERAGCRDERAAAGVCHTRQQRRHDIRYAHCDSRRRAGVGVGDGVGNPLPGKSQRRCDAFVDQQVRFGFVISNIGPCAKRARVAVDVARDSHADAAVDCA